MHRPRSAIRAAVQATAKGLRDAGVMDAATLRELELLCLPPLEELAPDQIRRIREATGASQARFARLLNTKTGAVQRWESGRTKPTGTALKLLHMVQKKGPQVLD